MFPHFPTISTNLTYPTRKYKKNNNPRDEMKYKRRDNSDLIIPIEEDDYRYIVYCMDCLLNFIRCPMIRVSYSNFS